MKKVRLPEFYLDIVGGATNRHPRCVPTAEACVAVRQPGCVQSSSPKRVRPWHFHYPWPTCHCMVKSFHSPTMKRAIRRGVGCLWLLGTWLLGIASAEE